MREFLQYSRRLRLTAAGLALAVAFSTGCIAQIRNGDQIAADAHLEYAAPERQTEEFLQTDPADARSALENPSSAGDWNDRAVLDARLQRLAAAEAGFEQAIQLAPDSPLAYFNLGRLYALLGEDARAGEVYRRMLGNRVLPDTGLYERATEMSGAGRLTEARWIMQALATGPRRTTAESSERNPGEQDGQSAAISATLWLAGDAMHALDYARAREHYDRVLAVDALEARALFGRGYISYLAEDWTAAAQLLDLARRQNSTEPGLPYFLTRTLFELERYDEALTIARGVSGPGLPLLTLHGRIRLIQDYRADLSDLLAQAPATDQARLRQIWYGTDDLRRLPELGGEFEFLY
jgi:tetratricopeptide (TPR) repeat protein